MSLMHIAFETLIRCKAVAGLLLYCLEITSGHLHLSTLAWLRRITHAGRWAWDGLSVVVWFKSCFLGEAHHCLPLSARILYFFYIFLHHHMTYPWAGLDPNKGTSLAPNPSCQSGTKAAKPTQVHTFLDLSSLVSESRSPLSRLMWVKQCE